MEEFKSIDLQILKNCASLCFKKYGTHYPVPNLDQIQSRKEYLQYRLGASFQQLSLISQIVKNSNAKHSEIKDCGEKIVFTMHSIKQVSYCLDNLIFNLASMSDYLGNYFGIFIFGPNSQTIKWSGLVNKANGEIKDSGFGKVLLKENKEWFSKLHSYRGDIIHRKAVLVEVAGFKNTRYLPENVDNLEFVVNNALKKYFHVFKSEENISITQCAEEFCKITLGSMSKLLTASESINFEEIHA